MLFRATPFILRAIGLTAILVLASPTDSQAGLIKVNERCSLADAIVAANTDDEFGGCLAGSGTDVLYMIKPGKLTTVFSGGNGTPTVTSRIIIKANGRSIYRGLFTDFRLFEVGFGGWLRIENARLFEGRHSALGGAIRVQGGGRLQLIDSIVEDSFAGTGGGAIAVLSGGQADLIRTIVRNNSAGNGGALFNNGATTTYASILEGNTTTGVGNTVYTTGTFFMLSTTLRNNAEGDAVIFNNGTLTLNGSTLVDNSSDTVGLQNNDTTLLTASTIELNTVGSAAVRNDSDMTAMNSTIRLNTPQNCSGTPIEDDGGNGASDPSCF